MVRKPDIQYVQEFYVHGSEARVIELKPRRRVIRTILPKFAPDKSIRIGVDPVALCGIVVAAVMLILLAVGIVIVLHHQENFVRIVKGKEIGLKSAIKGEHKQV